MTVVDGAFTLTVNVKLTLLPLFKVMFLQTMLPVPPTAGVLQFPKLEARLTNVVPTGTESLTDNTGRGIGPIIRHGDAVRQVAAGVNRALSAILHRQVGPQRCDFENESIRAARRRPVAR